MKTIKTLVLVVLLALAGQASAQTFSYGQTPAGGRHPIAVDAGGAVIVSAAVAGLTAIIGADGATAMSAANPLVCSHDATPVADAHPFPVRPSADGTNPVDATHPLPISGNLTANGPNNRLYTMIGVCYPDINPAATNYAACTGADQSVSLPGADGWYIIYIMGASGVATEGQAASLTGEGLPLFEGVPNGPFRIDDAGPALRVICTSVAGKIWVVRCMDLV